MIDIDKKYQTRDGRAVRLISNNGTPEYPIIGVIYGADTPSSWTVDGCALRGSSLMRNSDLVPVPDEVTMYAAASKTGPSSGYVAGLTRAQVEKYAFRNGPVLEVKLPIDSKPGAPPVPKLRASVRAVPAPFEAHNCLWLFIERKTGSPLKVIMPAGLAIRLRDAFNEMP